MKKFLYSQIPRNMKHGILHKITWKNNRAGQEAEGTEARWAGTFIVVFEGRTW